MTVPRRWVRQDEFDAMIAGASVRYGVPIPLIKAIIAYESAFNPEAYNPNDPGGAWGLMQMLPATAAGLGYSGSMSSLISSPGLAIDLGTKLLAENMKRTAGVVADSVSAYNGGWRTKLPGGGYTNQTYVNDVLALVDYFRAWEAQKGGVAGPTPVTFPADPRGGRGDIPTPAAEKPRMKMPWVAVAFGTVAWAAIVLALKGC